MRLVFKDLQLTSTIFRKYKNALIKSASGVTEHIVCNLESDMSCLLRDKGWTVKDSFRSLWPCIMNIVWREINQQDATNQMFIIKFLPQHVSSIIMPIIRRTRPCTTAYGVLHCTRNSNYVYYALPHNKTLQLSHLKFFPLLLQCRTPHAVVHGLVLLMMGIMMPETCWDRSLIITISSTCFGR